MILENGEVFEDCDNDKENGKGCARTELFFFFLHADCLEVRKSNDTGFSHEFD